MKNNIVKLYGLRRSGTNYTQWLLENNFQSLYVMYNQTGWKHGKVIRPNAIDWSGENWNSDMNPRARKRADILIKESAPYRERIENGDLSFLFIIKNPYHYLFSIHKYGILNREKEDEFHGHNIYSWAKRWSNIHENYMNFIESNSNSAYIKCEDYHSLGHEKILKTLSHKFNWKLNEKIINQPFRVKAGCKVTKAKIENTQNRNYMQVIKDLDRVNSNLNPDVMEYFGYDRRAVKNGQL